MFRSERQSDLPEIPQSASGPDLINKSEQDTRARNLPSGVRMMSFLDSVSTGVCSGWPLAGLLLSYHWQTVFWARRGGQGVILVEGPENMHGSHGRAGSACAVRAARLLPCCGWITTSITFIFLFLGI